MNQSKEILIIEDTNTGANYQELLENYNPNWNVTWVKTIDEMKKLNFLDRLHVFVFDQRLDNSELGTEAFKYVHEINPRVQGIMLSGVALAKDFATAQEIAGKSTVHHLVKDDVLQLPYLVSESIANYYTSIQKEYDGIDISNKIKFRLFAKKPRIMLLSHYVCEKNFIFDNEWVVDARVRSGEGEKKTESITVASKATIVTEVDSIITSDINLDLKSIKGALSSHFGANLKEQHETGFDYEYQKERTYKLPDIPISPDEDHPVEIKYEYNHIFQRIRAHISIDCSVCGIKSFCDFDVFLPVNRLAWRRVAHYALGKTQITPL